MNNVVYDVLNFITFQEDIQTLEVTVINLSYADSLMSKSLTYHMQIH